VIGDNPDFIILNEYEGVDINTPFEFQTAEIIYKLQKNK
jgi:CMP-N-acetylneuraminic acid synthetase